MRYEGAVIRPPSEADSLILQVTLGCSNNTCDFCGTYLGKPFRVRPYEEVVADIEGLPAWYKRDCRRVFLADGDALVLPQRRLLELLAFLREQLPALERVTSYANAQNLLKKSVEQLRELRASGLTMVYLGLESGDEQTLAEIHKGVTVAQQIEACRKAKDAGIELSLTCILGIAGVERSLIHGRATGEALSAIDPEFIGVLSLIIQEGTPIAARIRSGELVLPDPIGMLRELREMIAATNVTHALFRSNHASNYLPIGGRLPRDKTRMLAALDEVLARPDRARLRPEGWRAL
ncbi:MAG: coproporphyrinogen III oxidase [Actinobacteria bacterium ADurb.Bin444]|nr:MAG: coproporphyrinogen III oxidase [Actinobacteria bacterium ADurb.Bin444]